jgi:SsrA-binding protein
VNLTDAYCLFEKGELFLRNLFIAEYEYGTYSNHEPRRIRKLLLRRPELRKMERKASEKGFTIVPYRMYMSERGFVKVEIALAQGKKMYDKREAIKEKDNKRELERVKKIKL